MNKLAMTFALGFVAMTAACGDDSSTDIDMSGNIDMPASQFPAAPTIGATQLDRMGRAAINTALTDPFYTDKTAHNTKLDDYNKASQANWGSFTTQFAGALGVLDGLDGICGNQPLADMTGKDGGATGAYGALAGILANDQLLLATAVTSCDSPGNYLAVEVSVITGAATPGSCGGRTPLDNAINISYAALSGGLLSGIAVTDGITGEADPAANRASLSAFPYLGSPQ